MKKKVLVIHGPNINLVGEREPGIYGKESFESINEEIRAYAEKLGVSELMPLLCALDEVMIKLQHGVLHREQTLAGGGEYCDYYITGDREDVR